MAPAKMAELANFSSWKAVWTQVLDWDCTEEFQLPEEPGVYELAVLIQDHPMIVVDVGSTEHTQENPGSHEC
jgi:hypothetical protein